MKVNLRALSIAVAVCLGMLGAVHLASPESLGISAVAARWLAIVGIGLGLLQGFLPRVTGPTSDPDVLAERIVDMTPAQRRRLRAAIERHEPSPDTGLISKPPHDLGPEWLPPSQQPRSLPPEMRP